MCLRLKRDCNVQRPRASAAFLQPERADERTQQAVEARPQCEQERDVPRALEKSGVA